MKRLSTSITLVLFAGLLGAGPARADEAKAPATGFRSEFLWDLGYVEKKILGLAEAVPEDKYGWRPAEGVRSFGEILAHVAAAFYGIATRLGIKPPADVDFKTLEKTVSGKAQIALALKKAFAHGRQAATQLSDADLEKMEKAPWGREISRRAFMLIMMIHQHEHLGQATIYARSNGIVPPWILEQQKRMREKAAREAAK
jgi:uncharacterized damage-inducible protein DinB